MKPALPSLFASCCLVPALSAQLLDYMPTAPDNVLRTDSQVVVATNGTPITAVGGLFRFRNVTIPAGVTVRGTGPNPMVWVVDNLTVDGELSVSGQNGQRVDTLNSAMFPKRGGLGGPAGGAGGDGSPQIGMRSFLGMTGNGPGGAVGVGGTGGQVMDASGTGSGGGGGAFGTVGDPFYKFLAGGGSAFVQQLGFGGFGGQGPSGAVTRTQPGGAPGGTPFADADVDNNFVGYAFDVFQQRWIRGELQALVGGTGGGGGGDRTLGSPIDPALGGAFASDNQGGGGGGGGGCLVVIAAGRIVVNGRIKADGGHGGGGEPAGSCLQGGGGGGGSGGLLVLAAANEIVLEVRGETYANNDYDFVLSADGGVCRTGAFAFPNVQQKYVPIGSLSGNAISGPAYDQLPLGGFGGLGVVELMAPPGANLDGTNTVLDDNVRLTQNGVTLSGAQKRRYLAWRGFRDPQGVPVDDSGVATNIGSNEGDIRPAPILLPWL